MMKSVAICAFALLLPTAAFPANFSGKWIIQTPSRGGRMSQTVLILNQSSNELSGTVSQGTNDAGTGSPVNNEIYEPKVEGEAISFYVWRGVDTPAKLFYKGTLHGDEIDFDVTGGPLRQGVGLSGVTNVPPVNQHLKASRVR